ncbi:hypothetical protein [Saccharicrinis sp. FJH54]|uniref:hypothetical protein n=1 Tax=Saccharicrinis sp. FJH54 TaxID=3344665 RepID=UPI0035D503CB
MRILFDIGHPSFVHLFRKAAQNAMVSGYDVLFSYRNKDQCDVLLTAFGLPAVQTGKNYKTKSGKLKGFWLNSVHLAKVVRNFKPDLVLSGASPYASVVCGLSGIKHFVFDDTENKEQVVFYRLGSTLIFTPEPFTLDLGHKHIRYPGLHELAYLPAGEPARKIHGKKPTIFFRFVSWNATHDFFRNGFSMQQKTELIDHFKAKANIIISSEQPLPQTLEQYRYSGPVEKIHDALGSSDLYIGESATMASEAACMNVPAVYCDPVGRSYTDKLQQEYQLVYNFRCGESCISALLEKAEELLKTHNSTQSYTLFLKDYINLSAFIFWLIEHADLKNLREELVKNEFFKQF